jgi:hypothetical protein
MPEVSVHVFDERHIPLARLEVEPDVIEVHRALVADLPLFGSPPLAWGDPHPALVRAAERGFRTVAHLFRNLRW